MEEASFLEIMAELHRLFGPRRMIELLGWCALAGATMKKEDGPTEIRERLMKFGMSRSAAYRFTRDMKTFGLSLAERRGEMMPMADVLREINQASGPIPRDFVVK